MENNKEATVMASELIAEAITDYFGERCLDYAEGCSTCEAWAEYDRMNTRPAPAATDTGLVTVAKLGGINGVMLISHIKLLTPAAQTKYKDELVRRSQAEELLASERDKSDTWFQKYTNLKADNAVLTARVKELEQEVDTADETIREQTLTSNKALLALEAKLAAAEKALELSAARELALERISKILRGDVETDTIVTAVNRLNAAIDIAIRALSSPDHADAGKVEGDGLQSSAISNLIEAAKEEAAKAMRKFPQPNYVISKIAEEAGEVVKAAIHCAEGRENPEAVIAEIKQTFAMLFRLLLEGDEVHGLSPLLPSTPASEGAE